MRKMLQLVCIITIVTLAGCVGEADESDEKSALNTTVDSPSDGNDASNETSSEIEEITRNYKEVGGTEFKTPSEYESYFEGEIQADLEKLPREVQEYILNGASVHVVDTFVHDEEARDILIEANNQIPELNPNDVDALISNTVDENKSYEERLEEILESK